MFVMLPK